MKGQFSLKDFPPETRARKMATEILLNYELIGLHSTHQISAVEFYVTGPDFCDEANHCHPLQLESGIWYVHTAKNQESLKAPRYSGLDLACGNKKEGIHAGMLIRQLDFEGGSGLAIMKLMRGKKAKLGMLAAGDPRLKWTEQEKRQLGNLQGADAFQAPIRLNRRSTPLKGEILAKKRVGISGKEKADLLLHFALQLSE